MSAFGPGVERLRAILCAGAYLCTGLAVLVSAAYFFGMLDRTATLSARDVLTWKDNAYTISLQKLLPPGALTELVYPADSESWPTISSLHVEEDGHPLSPAHSLHVDIANMGAGRYSHWNSYLVFSASDNGDPRTNGRVYGVTVKPNLYVVGLFVVALAACGLFCTLLSYPAQARRHGLALLQMLYGCSFAAREILRRRPIVIAGEWLVVSVFAAIDTYFLFRFGITPWKDGDGWAYVRFADQLPTVRDWSLLPIVSADAGDNCSSVLRSLASCSPYMPDWRDIYVFLFRMPGYPLVILVCKWLAAAQWQTLLIWIQHFAAVVAAYVVYRTSSQISRSKICGFFCALVFVFSNRVEYDRAILTDSLCTSALTILVCMCGLLWDRRKLPTRSQLFFAGCSLALLFFVRETVLAVALAALPLIGITLSPARTLGARFGRLATVYAPLCAAVILALTWSYGRTGHVFVTTQPLSAGLYSAIVLEKKGTPVFTGDTVLDRVARQTLASYDYAEAMEINRRLLLEHNLSGPDQSALLQDKYFEIWRAHPRQMLALMIDNLKAWPYLFLVYDMHELLPNQYDRYANLVFAWGYFCAAICPAFIIFAGAFIKPLRRLVPAVLALLVFALLPTMGYAAFDIEFRYLIFATAPLLLIFALFGRSLGVAMALMWEQVRRVDLGKTGAAAGAQGYQEKSGSAD